MNEHVDELMLRWDTARQQGHAVRPDELCADCPELATALRQRIDAVEAMERVLGVDPHDPEREPTMMAGAVAPVHAAEPLPQIPGYEILGVLDQGGMGVVYQARQLDLGRIVAVKMIAGGRLAPRYLARFRKEAEAVARLQHPNFVQIFEVGQAHGRPFFSMEYVAGGSLAERIARERPTPRVAAELVQTLAQAIHTAHECGILHRDLKPANVMLTAGGVPKIADFGLAKRLDEEAGHTHTGEILGTPSYMSPEQATGRKDQTGPATDVYSLGVILYELLTGRPPHQGDGMLHALQLVVTEEPRAPSRLATGIAPDLEAICLKCLEKAPSDRYRSGQALADDLGRFLGGQPVLARRIGPVRRFGKWLRREPHRAGLLAVGALLLAVAMVLSVMLGVSLVDRERAVQRSQNRAVELAPLAREILERNCYECHGNDPHDIKKNLDVLNHALLVDSARKLVVPGAPQESRLLRRIADGSMPPEEEEKRLPRLADQELAILNEWILGGAPALPAADPLQPTPHVVPRSELAASVKAIFQQHCYKCHKYDVAKGGIKILHHRLLVTVRQVVVPYRPEESELFQLLTSKDDDARMPPADYDRLTDAQIATIREWIEEGAPPFPRTE